LTVKPIFSCILDGKQISSTNQTLATLAGGFVPMLLKNILPRKSVKLNLKTLSFKGQIDEVICEFKQNWPICDLFFEKDEPEPKKEEGETSENVTEKDGEKVGSPELKRKQSCESNLDGKGEEKEKPKENILEKYIAKKVCKT
jgi:hypothetical protein